MLHAQWYCLQENLSSEEWLWLKAHKVVQFADNVDYANISGVMAQLDFVVSTDTPIIHIAGAMGIPSLVMLSGRTYDWRRGIVGETSNPWYPSIHNLYAPHTMASWQAILTNAGKAIQAKFSHA